MPSHAVQPPSRQIMPWRCMTLIKTTGAHGKRSRIKHPTAENVSIYPNASASANVWKPRIHEWAEFCRPEMFFNDRMSQSLLGAFSPRSQIGRHWLQRHGATRRTSLGIDLWRRG